ncbi:MAG: YgcG family protein [Vulcanimicrobiota bacterium]
MKRIWLVFLLLTGLGWAKPIPDRPPDQDLWDGMQVLDDDERAKVVDMARLCRSEYGAPLAVVTIRKMADYDKTYPSIESFAASWFNHWALGTVEDNYGILLLVSVEDRKARIELGAGWGQTWNSECNHIMQSVIVPRFKSGSYDAGIVDGCTALTQMAQDRTNPYSMQGFEATLKRLRYWVDDYGDYISVLSLFPAIVAVVGLVVGMLLLLTSLVVPPLRDPLALGGGAIMGVCTFTIISLVVLVIYALMQLPTGSISDFSSGSWDSGSSWDSSSSWDSGSSWSSSSFSSGGGGGGFDFGGGGGFSGGGGATGSW